MPASGPIAGARPVPTGVSEFFADELALVRGVSRTAATVLAERSLVLVHELPVTWAALTASVIDEARATAIVRVLGGQSSDAGGAGGGGRGGGQAGLGAGGRDPAPVAATGRGADRAG